MRESNTDRFGLGWRDELGPAIYSHLERIDVIEVLADDHVGVPARRLRGLRALARQVPVLLHGTGLGLASSEPVDPRRLERIARVVAAIEPEQWSEHLAFVRGGGVELGHLAAPPRNSAALEGAARNVAAARRIVGSAPALENVATLVAPPRSDLDEAAWTAAALEACDAPLLLDLHNLHANATNFGFDPLAFLETVSLDRLAQIHLAGGRWIARGGTRRLLDDHLHDVPEPVFELLSAVAARVERPLTVVIERDGRYPSLDSLLAELDRARAAIARGRRDRKPIRQPARARSLPPSVGHEAELARIYVDETARAAWLERERGVDAPGVEMASESFARKRAGGRAR